MSFGTGAQTRRAGWGAVGPGGGDAAYRTQSLKYTPIELSLDESVPFQVLLRLWLTAIVVSWIVFVVFILLWLFTGGAKSSSTDAFGQSSGPNLGLLSAGALVSFVVFWVVLLISRLPEPIAEWKVLLEEKAPAAEHAYAAIYGSLARRRIPVAAVPARVRSDVLTREIVNNRLVISERGYVAYATVFAYGTSLYVGWTMWRNRFGAQLIGTFLKDLVGGMFGRTGMINQMLRTEKVRAMREAVHSAVREGVEVAIQGIEVSIVSAFGYEVPIQDLTVPVPQPPPGPLAPPAPQPMMAPQPQMPRPPMPQPHMPQQQMPPASHMQQMPQPVAPQPQPQPQLQPQPQPQVPPQHAASQQPVIPQQPSTPQPVALQPPSAMAAEQPTVAIPVASQRAPIQDAVEAKTQEVGQVDEIDEIGRTQQLRETEQGTQQ